MPYDYLKNLLKGVTFKDWTLLTFELKEGGFLLQWVFMERYNQT
jgi:hypothetical protein